MCDLSSKLTEQSWITYRKVEKCTSASTPWPAAKPGDVCSR